MRELEDPVRVELKDPQDFLKIKETLTRVGLPHRVDELDILLQVCHILHKRGSYYIVHYKELMQLDGDEIEITDDDLERRDYIATLLHKWGLCKMVDGEFDPEPDSVSVKVIPFKDKDRWLLKSKYAVGKKKSR